MSAIVLALLPVVAILVLGQALVRTRLFGPETWGPIERIVYFVLFPCLIVRAIATAEFEGAPVGQMAATLVAAQVLLAAAAYLSRLSQTVDSPAFASIFQSNVRWNTYVALAVAAGLYGPDGLALTAIAAGALIPVANILAVWGFVTYGRRREDGKRPPILKSLATNPLLMACVIGLAIRESGWKLPDLLSDTLQIMGGGTLALGLLAAGAGLDLKRLATAGGTVLTWSLVRVLGMPLIVWALGPLFGVEGLALSVAIIATSTPTAVNGYILAKQLGGDAQLSASLIAAQTVIALATMPVMLALLLP